MRLLPSSKPRHTKSHGEEAVYKALSTCTTLPWHAFHSLRLRVGGAFEGEGDFVIAAPDLGLLVLEVKGGHIELRDGHWLQNGKPMHKSPRDQAQEFVRSLIGELQRTKIETPPYGVACVFPDADFTVPPANGDLRGIVLGRRDLPHLAHILPDLFARAVRKGRVPTDQRWMEYLEKLWGNTWVPRVELADRVKDATERTLALDEEQYGLLETAGETTRALVEGPAGSGKTIVAAELCRRRALAGHKTLYLCFTDALARAVSAQFQDPSLDGMRPEATSIRQYAVDLLKKRGAPIPDRDKSFWKEVSFNAAVDALPPESERPSMVVVDEGQDFENGDWDLVEQLAGSRGLWVFQDKSQAFWADRPLSPSLDATLPGRLKLSTRYRCPQALATWAECFANGTTPTELPSAKEVTLVVAPPEQGTEHVLALVDDFLNQGLEPSDIAIITLAGQTRSELFNQPTLGRHTLVHGDAADASNHIVMETFLRFKGLERPIIIICETSGAHLTKLGTRMHIALTRATTTAVIIASRDVVDADPRLKGLLARK